MSATYDVLTAAEAAAVLSVDDSTQNAQLARVVTAVSRKLDHLCGPVVSRTVSGEQHTFSTYQPWNTRSTIELDFCPVVSFIAVTNYLGTTATVLTAQTAGNSPTNGYYPHNYKPDAGLYSGIVTRKTGMYEYPFGDLVVVDYVAGRYASTTSVDERFKEAATAMLRNSWRAYQQSTAPFNEFEVPQQTFPGFGVPNYVLDLLSDEIKPQVGFGG